MLSYIRKNYDEHLKAANHTNQDYEKFLKDLLLNERNQRRNNGLSVALDSLNFLRKNI